MLPRSDNTPVPSLAANAAPLIDANTTLKDNTFDDASKAAFDEERTYQDKNNTEYLKERKLAYPKKMGDDPPDPPEAGGGRGAAATH